MFVAWQQRGSDDLRWARKTATGWRKSTLVGKNTYIGCYSTDIDFIGPSAAFTSTGKARIAHACEDFVGSGSAIKLTSQTATGWRTKKIGASPPGVGAASAVSLDLVLTPSDKPHIVVSTWAGGLVRFRLQSGTWVRDTIFASGTCCKHPVVPAAHNPITENLAIAINHNAYGGSLTFGEWTRSGALVGSLETIPLDGDNAFGVPSLAFLPSGDPVIAFQKGQASKALVLARRTSGIWSIASTIDSTTADVGDSPSLVLVNGDFYVAYHNGTTGDLWYGTSTDGVAWATALAVGGTDVGEFPSLVVTPGGAVRVSHYDRHNTALKFSTGP